MASIRGGGLSARILGVLGRGRSSSVQIILLKGASSTRLEFLPGAPGTGLASQAKLARVGAELADLYTSGHDIELSGDLDVLFGEHAELAVCAAHQQQPTALVLRWIGVRRHAIR